MKAIGAAAALAALLFLAGVAGLLWLRGSLPPTEGRLAVAGLHAPVTIERDEHGVPRIGAQDEHDAYFTLGYVHAQDRLWQMEMQRRAGAGRLAELFGAAALPTDKFIRTLGLRHLAEASLAQLTQPARAVLDAYAEGVNAWLTSRTGPLPPEFVVLGHRPEPWQPVDSLVWGRLMAIQLSGNWREELLRAQVAARLSLDRLRTLWPPYPPDAPTTAGDAAAAGALLAAMPELVQPRLASNTWAVAGDHSTTGKPLLANDPHLGFEAPILWYLAALDAPGLSLTGATVPGVPFHLLGHNGRVAWGITTTHSDTMDLFQEREAAAGGYETPEGPRPFALRQEVITVKDAEPVVLTVRETRHGPLISDVLGDRAQGKLLALSATALKPEDVTAQAFYRMNRATDWPSFVAALRDFGSPQQNIAYADTAGNIGFYVPGRVPIRKAGNGTVPRPGWTGEFDWSGWVPFDHLPHVLNPASGRIVNANNKVAGDNYPYLLAADWPEPFRAMRIDQMLDGRAVHSADDFARMQMDTVSLMARDFLGHLPPDLKPTPRSAAALAKLLAWDGTMDRGRPEPLILAAWLGELQHDLLNKALGDTANSFAMLRPLFLEAALDGDGDWCADDGCARSLRDSLDRAVATLAARYGDDPGRWRWGDVHHAIFTHRLFANIPLLGRMSKLSIATSGGDFTINRGTYLPLDASEPFIHLHGAGFRAIYDLSNLADSRFIIATGQSGNPLSHHYDDLLFPWRDGQSLRIAPGRPSTNTLTLEPGQ